MKNRYWLCKRGKTFYSLDSQTGKRESLGTPNRETATQVVRAKNEAAIRPATINLTLAKAYLTAADPKLMERTWTLLMEEYCSIGKETTQLRRRRGVKSSAYDSIRNKKLIETTGDDLRVILKANGSYVNHTLRCLHNLGLNLGWILIPLIPPKLWPEVEKKPKRAITFEEHQRILEAEKNQERRLYYELLWEIGAAQTDGANLSAKNVDWENRRLSFNRQKTGELCMMEIGSRLSALLKKLPSNGPFFPNISRLLDRWRAAEFRRRCKILNIEGISLHSYRYAWAHRAKQFGMPERFAQSALGHASLAVHREYAKEGIVLCPSLEEYERKVIPFRTNANENNRATAG
ncbi:MAG TPA: tyrosine-type recombinase/integrase [Candidatus Baltobacteraceae bacterium]|nr:tyrosine-type recombinase/integrase [Candidatus Baltobacteraceae bacterium]